MAVRNANVAVGSLTTTNNTLVYTVPTDFVLLLKNIIMHNPALAAFQYFAFVGDNTANLYPLFATGSIAAGEVLYWSGWTALNGGQNISLRSTTAPTTYWISGALLPFNAAL